MLRAAWRTHRRSRSAGMRPGAGSTAWCTASSCARRTFDWTWTSPEPAVAVRRQRAARRAARRSGGLRVLGPPGARPAGRLPGGRPAHRGNRRFVRPRHGRAMGGRCPVPAGRLAAAAGCSRLAHGMAGAAAPPACRSAHPLPAARSRRRVGCRSASGCAHPGARDEDAGARAGCARGPAADRARPGPDAGRRRRPRRLPRCAVERRGRRWGARRLRARARRGGRAGVGGDRGISRAYLRQAVMGSLAQPLADLRRGIGEAAPGPAIEGLVAKALGVGHTSGEDGALGLLLGLAAWGPDALYASAAPRTTGVGSIPAREMRRDG